MRLDFIRPLYERRGPYASLYLSALGVGRGDALWGQLAGADRATVEALRASAARPAPGQALFASHGEVVLAETLPEPPRREGASWSALPYVTPLLLQRGENVPHVRVIVGREATEVTVVGGGSPRAAATDPRPWPLPKTAQGGWSRRTFRDLDVAAVAREVDEQVRRIGAELVVIAGEPRPRSLLCDCLGTKATDRVMMVEHGGCGDFAVDVEVTLDAWISRRRAELLERHRESEGPVGLEATVGALREGRVLAVLSPGELPRPMWTGAGGTQLATGPDELRRRGVESPVLDRADSAVTRAAAMTDAELWFSPDVGDVGAVLKY